MIPEDQKNITTQCCSTGLWGTFIQKDTNLEDCENSIFFSNETKTLEHNNGNAQSSHLSKYECGIALKEMQNIKSPGSDGLTADFLIK